MDCSLTAMYVWRSCVGLGYPCLESVLTTAPMADQLLFVVDPLSDVTTLRLVDALCAKYGSKARQIDFVWPIGKVPGDGSVIGVATQFAFDNVRTTHAINIQADEVYPVPLMEWIRYHWFNYAEAGIECMRFKVLHTERNAQFFQGGEVWDGKKEGDQWERGGLFNGKIGGAGYNVAVKLAKKCPAIKVSHDAWSFDNCATLHHCKMSDQYPIIHLHDMMRDHYIALRRNAADKLWTDQRFAHYSATANSVESSKNEWWNDEIWTRRTSPFDSLLPSVVSPLIGMTSYQVRWNLL